MVLYKANVHRALELQRLLVLNVAIASIQRLGRASFVRARVGALREGREALRWAVHERDDAMLGEAIASRESDPMQQWFKVRAVSRHCCYC